MKIIVSAFLALIINVGMAQTSQEKIRVNQIGYYPQSVKTAVVDGGSNNETFYVITSNGEDTLFTGTLTSSSYWGQSGETVRRADFSSLEDIGEYYINIPSVGDSYAFDIAIGVHDELLKAVLKGFYFQRASTELTSQYAGKWARQAGHDDDIVLVHGSVESSFYQEGDLYIGGSPKGWYDAGDYNKYIVNSGITTYSLLALFEHFPGFSNELELDIPEKNNNLPDILDEILWNLEWMLTMQDPFDGGVSHKLTSTNFTGTIMPHEDNTGRYYIYKSTAATLDFAAVMAVASRIFRKYENEKPGFSEKCLNAAKAAWNWARKNPNKYYNQQSMNASFNPDIHTGAYGDGDVRDEFDWAAAELYVTTQVDSFYTMTNLSSANPSSPGWNNVAGLPFMSLAHYRKSFTQIGLNDTTNVKNKIISLADGLVNDYNASPYRIAVSYDFYWGSNSVIANKGMMLMQAYYLTKDDKYLTAAMANLDYLMGRNALGYNMVTGFGSKSPLDPHHRISEADNVVEPVPGLLVGGPNGQDANGENCPAYPSQSFPAKRYLDNKCSFSTNEIAINWNAAISYLAGAIEAVKAGYEASEGNAITSTEETWFNSGPNVLVYPNPFRGHITVESYSAITYVEIHDLTGAKVVDYPISGETRLVLDLQDLTSGLYFISIHTDKGSVTKKIVKD